MTVWQRHFKGVLKQRSRLEVPAVFEREGEQYDVELSCPQLFDEPRRQVFDEIKPEGRIGTTQPGQNVGQQEWANSRDHPHPQGSAERLATGASGFDEIFPLIEYAPRPLDNVEAERGQYDPALGAVDEWGLKDVFQFLYAGAQGRLCHMTGPRRVPEMAVIGQHDQVLELAETRQVYHRLRKRPLVPVSVRIKAPALTCRRSVNATFTSSPFGMAAAAWGEAQIERFRSGILQIPHESVEPGANRGTLRRW